MDNVCVGVVVFVVVLYFGSMDEGEGDIRQQYIGC
jgi:hypothetical protein